MAQASHYCGHFPIGHSRNVLVGRRNNHAAGEVPLHLYFVVAISDVQTLLVIYVRRLA